MEKQELDSEEVTMEEDPLPPSPQFDVPREPGDEIVLPASNVSNPKNRRVLIAVDPSEHSTYAIKYAIEKVLNPSADMVYLVNVRQEVGAPSRSRTAKMCADLEAKRKDASHSLLLAFMEKLYSHGIFSKGASLKGDPRVQILRKVEEEKIDVLVVGSRGLGKVSRILLGSVSSYLVNNCSCNVLVVKNDGK